jgi:hypothetical protein
MIPLFPFLALTNGRLKVAVFWGEMSCCLSKFCFIPTEHFSKRSSILKFPHLVFESSPLSGVAIFPVQIPG